jgi:hypothetical protein
LIDRLGFVGLLADRASFITNHKKGSFYW